MVHSLRGQHANLPLGLIKNSLGFINVVRFLPNLEMRRNLLVNNLTQVTQPELRISKSVRAGHHGSVYPEAVIYTKLFKKISP